MAQKIPPALLVVSLTLGTKEPQVACKAYIGTYHLQGFQEGHKDSELALPHTMQDMLGGGFVGTVLQVCSQFQRLSAICYPDVTCCFDDEKSNNNTKNINGNILGGLFLMGLYMPPLSLE